MDVLQNISAIVIFNTFTRVSFHDTDGPRIYQYICIAHVVRYQSLYVYNLWSSMAKPFSDHYVILRKWSGEWYHIFISSGLPWNS